MEEIIHFLVHFCWSAPLVNKNPLHPTEAKVDSTYKNPAQWCKLSIQAAASMA